MVGPGYCAQNSGGWYCIQNNHQLKQGQDLFEFQDIFKKIYFFHYCILLVLCRKHFQLDTCSSIELGRILISKFFYLKLIRIAGICVALGVAHYRTTKHSQTANLRSTHIFPQRHIIVTTAKDSDDQTKSPFSFHL